VENLARLWRAGIRNWRASGRYPGREHGPRSARRRETGARHRRARFSTGDPPRAAACGVAGYAAIPRTRARNGVRLTTTTVV